MSEQSKKPGAGVRAMDTLPGIVVEIGVRRANLQNYREALAEIIRTERTRPRTELANMSYEDRIRLERETIDGLEMELRKRAQQPFQMLLDIDNFALPPPEAGDGFNGEGDD